MVAMTKRESVAAENSYEFKMKKVLSDLKAEPSTRAGDDWDPTEKVCRDAKVIIQRIVERGEMTEAEAKQLRPTESHAPRLSGMPKIHKTDVPMRGVVSTVGSPFAGISRFLVPILRKLQGRSGLYVNNSRELKEKIKHWRLERNEVLVSYDVKNLYPSIPIPEALELVDVLLKSKANLLQVTPLSTQSIMELMRWTFKLLYCEYEGKHCILNN